jgi:hypothetical protein
VNPHFVGVAQRATATIGSGSMIARGTLSGYSPNRHEFDGRSGGAHVQ